MKNLVKIGIGLLMVTAVFIGYNAPAGIFG